LPSDVPDPGWNFIRGANYDAHSPETHIAEQWPEDGPPILWTRELGQGFSAFVAQSGRVYTQRQTLAGQSVICLDAETGATVWEYRYDWPYEPAGVYPGPRATPTISDGHVYFAAPSGLIGCLTADSGHLVWSRNIVESFHGKGVEFGYSCSPVVVDQRVIFPVGGAGASIVALDTRTGDVLWQAGDDPASYTPAYPITFRGRSLVIGYMQNALVICETATGRALARLDLSRGYDEHAAWPIYSEPYLWISGPFQWGSQLYELTEDGDALRLQSVWKERIMSNDIVSSVLVNGTLYGFDVRDPQAKTHRPTRGHFRAIDFLSGREHWSNAALNYRSLPSPRDEAGAHQAERDGTKGDPAAVSRIGHSSVIVADGKLLMLNDTGELILARASAERYEELSRVLILGGEISWTPPILHRGRVFARNHSRAVCVYVGDPSLLETRRSAASMKAADLPQGKYRDWASVLLSVEPEYAFDVPSDAWLRQWYYFSMLGVLAPAACAAAVMIIGGGKYLPIARVLFCACSFLLGAAGTTAFSFWTGDFVFTWHACLFAAFWWTVQHSRPFRLSAPAGPPRSKWHGYAAMLVLLGSCAAYFLMCRRFSLLFEWVFLAGFPAATPPALLSLCWSGRRHAAITELLCACLSFTLFHWSAVWILWVKY
jgi:hypothetical protein